MKKTLRVFIPLFLMILACSSGDSPKSVAEKFLTSWNKQDYEGAKKYGTEDTKQMLNMMSGFAKLMVDSTIKEKRFEILREKIEGDKATVFYKEAGKENELQLPVVKENGKWKVLMSKETLNESEGNIMDLGATNTDTITSSKKADE